jgi:hypothetical protein
MDTREGLDAVEEIARTIWLAEFGRAFSRVPSDPWENQADSTREGHRNTARKLVEAGLAGDGQGTLDRKGAAAAAEAICDYTDNNLTMMDACDMDTSKAKELFEAAKRLRDMLASPVISTQSNTVAEPSRCKNPVARGESKEADALTGDAPVALASTPSSTNRGGATR